MSWTPHPSQVPHSEHLREDINLPAEPASESAADFSDESYTSMELNAGQQVPGLSPHGEYRRGDDPERRTAPTGDGPASPEES